ncbi:hypothetical protein [Azomonas agilis]|nr:hypothetical protein [Azomonas agilis]
MTEEVELAILIAGLCCLFWVTGYGFGSVIRFYRRIFSKVV